MGGLGITVNDSANTIVRGNTVFDNADGGIGVGQSAKTTQVLSNEIHANRKDGIVLYTDATATQIMENTVHDNERYGIFVKTEGTATIEHNNVFNNAVGLFTDVKQPQQIAQRQNQFHGNHEAQIGAGTQ
jgi:parallel beta-helix repeat protein